ncbi:MAG: tetratricopeptide repeat protein [Candidatus Nitronauta litoralis]|uniref:Tetratricopeptide repeat protein n=1 Tax=Candidatus Nitronauta litoralis TaxID=2705533 RepID=A0A7T0FZV0_9BACT|nr:MAG: tetratricopeptide repeat protein [Candidatus Nitronauta litoralis]
MKNPHPFQSNLACLLVIITAGLLVYANHLLNPFQYDSVRFLSENHQFADPARLISPEFVLKEYFHRGGLFWTYGLNAWLHGMDPFGFHLINLMFHLMNGALIFLVTQRALPYFNFTSQFLSHRGLSLAVALLFVLHPIQTETVVYVMSRSELIAGWFYLLGFYFFQRETGEAGSEWTLKNTVRTTLVTLLFIILGYSIKPTIITLPATMLAYFLLGRKKEDPLWDRIRKYKIVIIAGFLVSAMALTAKLAIDPFFLAGTSGAVETIGRQTYLLTQPWVIMFYYLKLLLFPFGLNIDPEIVPATTLISWRFLAGFSAITISLWVAFKKPSTRLPLFGLIWFFIVLSPSSSFVTLLDLAAEHRVYLAAYGVFVIITLGLARLINITVSDSPRRRGWFFVTLLLLLLTYGTLTIKRNQVWSSEVTLWEDVLEKSPNKVRALVNLGHAYTNRGNRDKAIDFYQRSLKKGAHYFQTYYNVAVLYLEKGETEKAFEHFQIAARIDGSIPDVHARLGDLYMQREDWKNADAYLRKAVELNPGYASAFRSLGILHYYYMKEPRAGVAFLKRSLHLNPDQPDADKVRALIAQYEAKSRK